MSHATKKWEIFPGRNKFCWDGRIIMGPDVTVFYINIFLIVGTSLLFVIYVCPSLTVKVSPFILIVTVLLFVFVMSTLLKTSFTDPGIIPRATADEALYIEKQIKISTCGDVTDRPPPRTKEVFIRGQSVKLKYCFTCKIFRPPRASHCSLCDNCVDHFDHHCPWVGNCVGRRNYRYFYLFTVGLSVYIAFVFVCTCAHLYLLSENHVVVDAVTESPASVIVLLVTFFSCWSVFGLAGFHTYLAVSNQTTNEDIKGSFSNKRDGSSRNPYTSGNGCSNCCYVLCGPFTPSLIDRTGFISPVTNEKKVIADRQLSRQNTPTPTYTASSDISSVHYPSNGTKMYPAANTFRLPSTVISAQPVSTSRSFVDGAHFGKTLHVSSANNFGAVPQNVTAWHSSETATKVEGNSYPKFNMFATRAGANERNSFNLYPKQMTIDLSKIDLDLDEVEAPSSNYSCAAAKNNTRRVEPLNASKLQLMQDTTMIESALDLDSLEESTSSAGANSHLNFTKMQKPVL